MKNLLLCLILVTSYLLLASPVNALKKRVYGTTSTASSSRSVVVSPGLRRDHGALILNISGLSLAKSVSYELTYTGSGQEQGVFGNIDPTTSANNVSRSLYFGTCSHNVCTPHYGVTNTRLTVIVKTTTGKTITKRYRIKT